MYKKILVPHAGTSAGDLALKHAIHIAKSSESEIILLHVLEDFPHVPVLSLHSSQAAKLKREFAQITKDMKQVMEDEMSKRALMCQKHGIKSSLKVVTGLAAEEILKIIKNQKMDLVVMAKRRKLKGIKSLLSLGSVSRKIVENTSCPVLMIDAEKK
ncbi:MAG: universal stress protein [Nitrososphaeria archaeon]|nr:universal stress protein [Nitrosopumilaceae archaeon]NIP09074.1 universal stress protein [Nitrosopumilaceae archaeon]NIP91443.1 universal stress protein [Nitrososphaeria archaeon]NIS95270.1 universal stress protein [Nitrosopumilaceae archaeon]